MCARVRLVTDYSELKIKFWIKANAAAPNLRPSWNLAPTDPITVVMLDDSGERMVSTMRWGLIPSWSRDEKLAYSTFNARAEGLETKSTFRDARHAARGPLVVMSAVF